MSELWIAHHSIDAWQEPNRWAVYFAEAQRLLGSPLTHLDVNDPVRRKVDSLSDAASFVCGFGPRENSRWLLGKFKAIGVVFSIRHFRQLDRRHNSLTWYLPLTFVEKTENRQRLRALFDSGNRSFKPFYAYSDDVVHIASKNKPSGSVDIQTELPGVFWMTYFNAAYASFFGKEKFNGFPGIEHGSDGSITFVLGDSAKSVANDLREQAAAMLGKQSFVNPEDILGKPPGRFALTFRQLLTSPPPV